MDQRFPTHDPLDGLHFTFKSDEAQAKEDAETRTRSVAGAEFRTDSETRQNNSEPWLDRLHFGETPMTDPRSLGSSALLHVLLIALASLTVLNAAILQAPETSTPLRGELDPADNRASKGKIPGAGGGAPGEIGGLGSVAFVAPAAGDTPQGAGLDPEADALLHEILPSTVQPPSEMLKRAIPGPQTTGVGLIPGSGMGGGGGSGGGSGGGIGHGVGPGTEFFGARENGVSFAYVIDCSGSMALRNSLEIAKRELLTSLNQLPPDARFSVIFYNLRARIFSDPSGQQGLMPATAANKLRVQSQLETVAPDGGTNHMTALRTALGLRPEVIFFLTDADMMIDSDVNKILAESHGTRIQAVEFGRGRDLGMRNPLRRLATTTGGTYRYIDVTEFPRSANGY